MNKEIYKHGLPSFLLAMSARNTALRPPPARCQRRIPACFYAPGRGITGMPFTRNWVLETITRSPTFSPEEME